MDDSKEVKKRIQKATAGFAMMKNLLQNKSIPITLQKRTYDATVLNILLFGCESWALKIKDRDKLEACHHKFLRAMLNLSMMDVKEQRISNKMVREELHSYSIMQIMEMQRAKWLQKLAEMPASRNPRKLFVSWIRTPRPPGRPRQTIRHGYAETLKTFYGKGNTSFNQASTLPTYLLPTNNFILNPYINTFISKALFKIFSFHRFLRSTTMLTF